ncbi:MAG: Fic family protein [Candidatus Brocadiaceae bacterium]|nr:Fic family protein [Candidatus Brocadiaceae bacterium]
MKKPEKPETDWFSVLKDPETFRKVLIHASSPIHKGKYIHWEKTKYQESPKGLSRKEWWAALKIARSGQLREVPLYDISKKCFKFSLPDPALEYLHHIDQGAGGHIEMLGDGTTNPRIRDRYIAHSLIEEAITSSQLEGATTTRKVAKEMLRLNRKPLNKGEQMIVNNYKTMRLIRERAELRLSKELVLELHRYLTENTLEDAATVGRFRKKNEDIKVYETASNEILYIPPPAGELEKRIETMCKFANEEIPKYFIHPVIRAIILHFWLAYDHPFVDGNGRCARALFYWYMLRKKYWLFEFISISQIIKEGPSKYGRAFLYTESDDNDLTYFILYHLKIVTRAIEALHDYIAWKTKTIHQAELLLRKSSIDLNYRQIALLSHSLRNQDFIYTVRSHKNSHKIAYETARSDLFDLVTKGFMEKQKRGKTYEFHPIKDLAEQVS